MSNIRAVVFLTVEICVIASLGLLFAPIIDVHAEQSVTGVASVIDGDTIEIHGQRVRLVGIDAPESAQLCKLEGKPWRCGQAATNALAEWIGQRTVACRETGRDRYGRVLDACSVAGKSVSRWLAVNGWAVASIRYSQEFVSEEAEAKAAKRGIWASQFQMPWEWRKER